MKIKGGETSFEKLKDDYLEEREKTHEKILGFKRDGILPTEDSG